MIAARLELFFPGLVRSKERARVSSNPNGGFARMYTPTETVEAEKAIRSVLVEWKRSVGWAPEESWNGPVHLRLYALYPCTKTTGCGFEHTVRPDVDNCVKSFMDAAQDKTIHRKGRDGIKRKTFIEGIMTNDCRVSSMYVRKVYTDMPVGALLVVEFLEAQTLRKVAKKKKPPKPPKTRKTGRPRGRPKGSKNRPKVTIDSLTVSPLDLGEIPILMEA